MEEKKEKRFYVDFYDMIDRWGGFGFFAERLFDELPEAIKLCDKLNSELDESNKKCGEHYGVIDNFVGREIYCGMEEKYKIKITDIKTILLGKLGDSLTEDKKFYILGKVYHQDDTNPIELLGEADTEQEMSDKISLIMNDSFSPKNIFAIEGVKRNISIKSVSIK